jgi:hypothetical protein
MRGIGMKMGVMQDIGNEKIALPDGPLRDIKNLRELK